MRRIPRKGRSEAGVSTLGSLLILVFGGGLALVVVSLFLTGLAQREIIPRIRARTEQAGKRLLHNQSEQAPPVGGEGAAPQGAIDPSAARGAQADSLQALAVRLETQRRFLESQKQDLVRLRSGVDSVLTRTRGGQVQDVVRQAKLLAGMRPEEAAQILESMEDGMVSALLQKMNARIASKVMAKLDPRRAARLTAQSLLPPNVGELASVHPSAASGGPAGGSEGRRP